MLTYFPICSKITLSERHLAIGIKYAVQIKVLIEEFNNRLTLSTKEKLHLKIIENPFLIDPEEAASH